MSNQKSGNRRNTNRNAKRAARRKLETLPELPASDLEEPQQQTVVPPTVQDSVYVEAQDKQKVAGNNSSDGGSTHKHEERTADTRANRSGSTGAGSSEQGQQPTGNEAAQRPRSRTASPWRGRGRGVSSIFARPSNQRPPAARQNSAGRILGDASGGGSSRGSSSGFQSMDSPVKGVAINDNGPSSAGLISERNAGGIGGTNQAAAGHRRRGHTLDPEQLEIRHLSPLRGAAGPDAVQTRDANTAKGRNVQSATTSHFNVAVSNATLSTHYQRQISPRGYPTKLTKMDSASSTATAATVEIDENPLLGQDVERSATIPRGQLSRMLYKEVPGDYSNDSPSRPFSPETQTASASRGSPNAGVGAPSLPSQSSNAIGRPNRGGSGSEPRFDDFKGALTRQQSIQSVFGNRPRQTAIEQTNANACEGSGQLLDVPFSGPVEIPGTQGRSGGALATQRHHGQQRSRYGLTRPGRSSGDDSGELMPAVGVLRRMASKEALSSTQQTKAVIQQQPQQQPVGQHNSAKGKWLYTPPGERTEQDGISTTAQHLQLHQPTPRLARVPTLPLQNELVGADYQHLVRHPEVTTGNGIMFNRRDSSTADRSLSSDQMHHFHANSGATQSTSRDSGLSAVSNFGVPMATGDTTTHAAETDGRFRHLSSGDAYDDNYPELYRNDRELFLSPTNTPQTSPWSFKPSRNSKKFLKFKLPGRWSAIAAGPNDRPTCVVAGHDGLYLHRMGLETDTQSIVQLSIRRWTLAQDFKDVIWRPSDMIVTGSNDGTVTVWDPSRNSDHIVHKFSEFSRPVNRLTHRPGDPHIFYTVFTGGGIVGWDMRTPTRPVLRITVSMAPQDIHCNPQDPDALGVMTQDGRITTWDVRSPHQHTRQFVAHGASRGQCIAWHPSGRFIASGGSDKNIKIWDLHNAASKKIAPTPYCTIRTLAHLHRLEWRPGQDTQISSCSFVDDTRMQVWDMHNPNHSLMYHDKHNVPIVGFTWYDKNTVWSVGRDDQVIQCDMQSDGIITRGLLSNTVADFSPSTRMCVAVGEFDSRLERSLDWTAPQKATLASQNDQHGEQRLSKTAVAVDSSSNRASETNAPFIIDKFMPDLPVSFVDEHLLDTSVATKSKTIRFLAQNYRYDSDKFKECCEANMLAAETAQQSDIAKFWQLLSVAFGDVLPLKSRWKSKMHTPLQRQRQKQQKQEDMHAHLSAVPSSLAVQQQGAPSTAAVSTATSRSSSGMFPSKSVTDIPPKGESSDDDPHTKYPNTQSQASFSRISANGSPAPVRLNFSSGSLGVDAVDAYHRARLGMHQPHAGRLERNFMSLSHSNLQQVGAAANKGRGPSPLPRSAAHSLSHPQGNYVSEPATPVHGRLGQQVFQSFSTNPNLTTEAAQRYSNQMCLTDDDDAQYRTQDHLQPQRKFFLHDDSMAEPRHSFVLPTPRPVPKRPTFIFNGGGSSAAPEAAAADENTVKESTRLHITAQRNASKADLKLVVDSCTHYANIGDVQTAITAALLMRNFIRLRKWSATKGWICDYIDQLDQHQEYSVATDIILSSPFPDIQGHLAGYQVVVLSCTNCNSKIEPDPDTGYTLCSECDTVARSCTICEMPVKGRFIWCKGCGHGGHAEHMNEWFDIMHQNVCPAGCGHCCLPSGLSHSAS
ncbi:SEA (Seh1-associated) complex subunit [Coemansia sp. RSA 988]|nr:SEA (Seh1-associated) complex subunit [Coemansia sp. RSA 988]